MDKPRFYPVWPPASAHPPVPICEEGEVFPRIACVETWWSVARCMLIAFGVGLLLVAWLLVPLP